MSNTKLRIFFTGAASSHENVDDIANFTLGRAEAGGEAIALLYVDEPISDFVLTELSATEKFIQVKRLEFDV